MAKRIAILGAGASGIAAIKCCLDEGLLPVCYERSEEIGGIWHYTDTVCDQGARVMKSAVMNFSKEMMAYSDFPVPADFPNYMHNTRVFEYFKSYTKRFDLEKYIQFEISVNSIKQTKDFESTGRWRVEIQHIGSPDIQTEVFDAVFLCTGLHSEKLQPHFEGDNFYKGQKIHTYDYKDHHGFEDKRVVVIGIGNSGGDVAVELSKVAKQVYLSTRHGAWVKSKVSNQGLPVDLELSRFGAIVKYIAGANYFNNFAENQLNSRFDHAAYGLKPNHRYNEKIPLTNDELPSRIVCGSIIIKPNIASFHSTGVEFEDGTVVEDIDTIIYATGYTIGFPFLDKKIIDVKDNKINLYSYAFPPDLEKPTLAVIGCVEPWGAIIPVAELQCRWAVRVFKGVTKLPSTSVMYDDIKKKQREIIHKAVTCPRHTLQVDWIKFMDEMAEQIGCKPNIAKLFLSDPSLAMKVYFGPCTPYQYRLQGPDKWTGAREAIMTTMDRVYKPFQANTVQVKDWKSQTSLVFVFSFLTFAVIIKLIFF